MKKRFLSAKNNNPWSKRSPKLKKWWVAILVILLLLGKI
jgi:hypothetical protein